MSELIHGTSFPKYKLRESFIDRYRFKEPSWDLIGEFVYYRTYSRRIEEENRNEVWFETIRRVVEGVFNAQKKHCLNHRLPWSDTKAHESAELMYDRIFTFKFLPPGRGLWVMGSQFVDERGGAALNNCGFVSTEDIDIRGSYPFAWTMDALMLGVGIGFDTKGAGKIFVKGINKTSPTVSLIKIEDSREGWVKSVETLINAYFNGDDPVAFDYSLIRPEGAYIRGFGGTASGPGPLKMLHERINTLLTKRTGETIKSTDIVDLMNMIGVCVVAGNVRRSAEIAIGDADDFEYATMKDPDKFSKELMDHRWASNNSIFAEVGETDYSKFVPTIARNGEPGIVWLDQVRGYGRLADPKDYVDSNAKGVNPCFDLDEFLLVYERNQVTYKSFRSILSGSDKVEGVSILTPRGLVNGSVQITGLKKVVRVEFDNGNTITCTPDHRFMLDNGTECEAKDLVGKKVRSFTKHTFATERIFTGELLTDEKISVSEVVNVIDEGRETIVCDFTAPEVHWGFVNGMVAHNCGEQTLESYEVCNLVETYPEHHDSYEDYQITLKMAYMYAKSVALIGTHWPETNAVMLKNRRIGTSQSGIIDAFTKHKRRTVLDWSDRGYKYLKHIDKVYSDWLCVPRSLKMTTVKPSGTVSLLSGSSAGIHYPFAEYYIRRVRVASSSPLCLALEVAGIPWEYSVYGETEEERKGTKVFSFPVHKENFDRSEKDVSIWEQVKNVVDYQRHWADNNVSCTVKFKPEEVKDIAKVLECYEDSLKSISFLPHEHGYQQAPLEEIVDEVTYSCSCGKKVLTEEEAFVGDEPNLCSACGTDVTNRQVKSAKEIYEELIVGITRPEYKIALDSVGEKYCSNDTCTI